MAALAYSLNAQYVILPLELLVCFFLFPASSDQKWVIIRDKGATTRHFSHLRYHGNCKNICGKVILINSLN